MPPVIWLRYAAIAVSAEVQRCITCTLRNYGISVADSVPRYNGTPRDGFLYLAFDANREAVCDFCILAGTATANRARKHSCRAIQACNSD